MYLALPLIIAIIGLIVYFAFEDKKTRIGEIMFFVGLFFTVFHLATKN